MRASRLYISDGDSLSALLLLLGGGGPRLRYALVVEGVGLVDQRVEAADEGGGLLSGLHHALGEGVGGHLVVFLVHAEADFLGALDGGRPPWRWRAAR